MTSFLFWNIDKQGRGEQVGRLAAAYDVDVLALAECQIARHELEAAINRAGGHNYRCPESGSVSVRLCTRLPPEKLFEEFTYPLTGLNVWQLRIGAPPGALLALLHFPSKLDDAIAPIYLPHLELLGHL